MGGSMVVQCALSQAEWCTGIEELLDSLSNRRLLTNFSLPGYCQRDNLKMAGWVPQKAVLAHVNLECFITHCGQGAVSEALQHGVPIVAYPFFHDQIYLAQACRSQMLNTLWILQWQQGSRRLNCATRHAKWTALVLCTPRFRSSFSGPRSTQPSCRPGEVLDQWWPGAASADPLQCWASV